MNEWAATILVIAASALLAWVCYVRGSAHYEENIEAVRACQLAGGGDRECWKQHK